MPIARYLLLTGVAVGLARVCGFSLLEWVITACTILYTALNTVFTGLWQIIHPSTEPQASHLPDLHQAILKVTQDATRVADLLEDFMGQYKEDPGLRDKFMAYMAAQANTSYSVVDNQLSWVLWLYSMIWMPLLIVMCFARAARSSRPPGSAPKQPAMPSAVAAGSMQALGPAQSHNQSLAAEMSGDGAGDSYSSLHADENLRRSVSALYPAAAPAAADWPPAVAQHQQAGSDRSGSGSGVRSMRCSATFAPQRHSHQLEQQLGKQHRSSDSFLRPSQLPAAASLPAHLLTSTGSSSLKRVSTSTPGNRFQHTASGAGDVCYGAGDQSGVGSIRSVGSGSSRSLHKHQTAGRTGNDLASFTAA